MILIRFIRNNLCWSGRSCEISALAAPLEQKAHKLKMCLREEVRASTNVPCPGQVYFVQVGLGLRLQITMWGHPMWLPFLSLRFLSIRHIPGVVL